MLPLLTLALGACASTRPAPATTTPTEPTPRPTTPTTTAPTSEPTTPAPAPALVEGTLDLEPPAESCTVAVLARTLRLERSAGEGEGDGWQLRYDDAVYPAEARADGPASALEFTVREQSWITFDDHAHDFTLEHRFDYRLRVAGERVWGRVRVREHDPDGLVESCSVSLEGRFTPAEPAPAAE
ncbi:MAG TPA: hypothetical protein RMH85_28740 [Polyangiaceae bacterium LLY-WYZ-15_(1-7)]|nr:hypothetical protein [Myxococcales bacterium]MAT27256.1 hypothetical protein [Sandaracinus sp.]HJK91763.1 hypothetical protein [Polyangiaceae bacterium LLY-WYZ-15_(1-7)]MBJ70050.1 hypothetical protein [Sandaracinus sp.]HJL02342.1 hypothetical protein [Polyangiaceae bacterium LLY-WYZ-15_(1-7)]